MTGKNKFNQQIRIFCRALMTASLCAGLLLSGCGSKPAQGSGSESAAAAAATTEKADAAVTAAAAQSAATAVTASTAAQSSTADSAAAAATGAQVADPDWTPDKTEEKAFSAKDKGLVIVLDPGHASQVPGTMEPIGPGATELKEADTVGTYGPSSAVHEYDLTMNVAQKVRAELEDRGYEVKLTHRDTFNPISCVERASVANENNADAFIRIHANGSDDTEAHGAMTICITEDNPYHPELYKASARLSDILLDTYCNQTEIRREYVWETDTMTGNNWAEVPTSLIELGYMTNPDEDLKMNQDSSQKEMANAIADALDKWFAEMPEEELSMHPSLTAEKADSADTSSTAETAGESSTGEAAAHENTSEEAAADEDTADQADTGNAASEESTSDDKAAGQTDALSTPDIQTSDPVTATPAFPTPAGTSSGNGTGITINPDSDSE